MDQTDISELLSAYLDGESTPAERAEVERLLESSPRWRTDLDHLARLSELIRGLPRESAPPDLAAAVQRRLAEKSFLQSVAAPKRSLRREWLAALAGMAVTVAAMLIGIQVLERGRSPHHEFAASRAEDLALSHGAAPPSKPEEEAASIALDFVPASRETPLAESLLQRHGGTLPAADPQRARFSDLTTGQDALTASTSDESSEDLPEAKPDWDKVRIGDSLTVFERTSGVVAVVELTVIDINGAGGQLELLLAKSGLNVLPEGDGKDVKLDKEAKQAAPQDAAEPDGSPQLRAIYVTAPRATISLVLDELGRQGVISEARLQPPVDAPLAMSSGLEEKSDKNSDSITDQPAAVEQAEQALVNEAVVVGQNFVGQNYRQARRSEGASPPPLSASAIENDPSRASNTLRLGAGSPKPADQRKMTRRPDVQARQNALGTAPIKAGSKVSPTDFSLANSAVPMTLNPTTGEVTNYFNYFGQSGAKQTPRKSGVTNGSLVESKSKAAIEAESVDGRQAAADDVALAEQHSEPVIRVLFVVKRADTQVAP